MVTTIIYTVLTIIIIGLLCAIVTFGAGQKFSIREVAVKVPTLSPCADIQLTEAITSEAYPMPGYEAKTAETSPCIRCARCAAVCVPGLEPYLLSALIKKQLWQQAHDEHILHCVECGLCNNSCPANRPLLNFIKHGKAKVGERGIYN